MGIYKALHKFINRFHFVNVNMDILSHNKYAKLFIEIYYILWVIAWETEVN